MWTWTYRPAFLTDVLDAYAHTFRAGHICDSFLPEILSAEDHEVEDARENGARLAVRATNFRVVPDVATHVSLRTTLMSLNVLTA